MPCAWYQRYPISALSDRVQCLPSRPVLIWSPSGMLPSNSSCFEHAAVEHFGNVKGNRPDASYFSPYSAFAIPLPFWVPGSHVTRIASTPWSQVLVIIGPGAFMTTTTGLPIFEYFLMSFTSFSSNCSVLRSVPSLAFSGTTTMTTTSALAASEFSPPAPGQDGGVTPSMPLMPSPTLTYGCSWQAMPFQPLPPPMARGLVLQASDPTRATLLFLEMGSTPPSFLRTTDDSAMIRLASSSLHGCL
mmetsp:Transcript_112381/g.305065  ORF Transcript_112381/g.305065 Transcript_112381/m.305065 type:complete len:245 (+) Transcript_112381:559-1293(+)